jgi:hypothetical protein
VTKKFLPEAILVTVPNAESLAKLSKHQFFAGKEFAPDKTTVFVCKNFACSLPLQAVPEIEKLLF